MPCDRGDIDHIGFGRFARFENRRLSLQAILGAEFDETALDGVGMEESIGGGGIDGERLENAGGEAAAAP